MDAFTPTPFVLFLLEVLVKGTILLSAAAILTAALRRTSAAVRHGIWSLAFAGLLVLPLSIATVPSWEVALPSMLPVEQISHPAAPPQSLQETPITATAPQAAIPLETSHAQAASLPSATTSWPWMQILLMIWAAGALALLARLGLTLAKLTTITRCALPVSDPEWTELSGVLVEVLDIRRPVRILQHKTVMVPMTYGLRKPVVLLPVEADAWPEEQKQVTLMHELMHIRRLDYLAHVLAIVARALHWFNPMAWYGAKQLLLEREQACDDGVLSMGIARSCYADHLLETARFVLTRREAPTGALAMARPSDLRKRIVAILDPARQREGLTRLRAFGMSGCALAVLLPVASLQPNGSRHLQTASNADFLTTPTRHEVVENIIADHAGEQPLALAPKETPVRRKQAALVQIALEENDEPSDTSHTEAQKKAVFALSQLPTEQSIPLLTDIAKTHKNATIRAEAAFWLGQEGGSEAAAVLASLALNDASEEVQKKAVFALSQLPNETAIPELTRMARTHQHAEMRAEAVFWLGQKSGEQAAEVLEDFARNDASEEVQKKAIFALSQLDHAAAIPRLIDLAKTHPDAERRSEAIFWLGQTGDPRAADVLMDIINQP